jgi:hypothetical protein
VVRYTLRFKPAPWITSISHASFSHVFGGSGAVFVPSNTAAGGTLIADGTKRAVAGPPGCTIWSGSTPILQDGQLLYDCNPTPTAVVGEPQLMSVNHPGVWRTVPTGPLSQQCSGTPGNPGYTCQLIAIGSRWLQYWFQPSGCEQCGGTFTDLVSTTTGALTPSPTKGHVIADLNAAHPARTRCPAVTATRADAVQFVGDLALIRSQGANATPMIERCGTRTKIKLRYDGMWGSADQAGSTVATNKTLIIWWGSDDWLSGIQARSHRRFSIKLPPVAIQHGIEAIALTKNTLYLTANTGKTLTAALPSTLR